MGLLFVVLVISLANLAIGFVAAVRCGLGAPTLLESFDILAGAGGDGLGQGPEMSDEWTQPTGLREGEFQDMLRGLVATDLNEMLDDHSADAEDVAPEDEPYDDDVAQLMAPDRPEHWYLNEKYVETSILKLNIAMMKSGKRATDIDTELRNAGDAIDADTIEICVQQLREDCESYLVEQEEAARRMHDRLDEFGELASLAEEIEMANLEQAAQIETTISNLTHMDFTEDIPTGRRRLLEELGNLRMARHRLRDSQEVAFLTVARYEGRLGEIDEQLYNDELTGLRNRIGAEAILSNWWQQNRHKSRQIAVALLDLDHCTELNEAHGSLAGDQLIAHLGRHLQGEFGKSDFVARFAGQVFLIVTVNAGYRNTLKAVETIRQWIEKAVFIHNKSELRVTATAAVTEVMPDDSDEAVLQRVEKTLKAAKRSGTNCLFALDPKGLDPEPELIESPSFVSDYATIHLT